MEVKLIECKQPCYCYGRKACLGKIYIYNKIYIYVNQIKRSLVIVVISAQTLCDVDFLIIRFICVLV